MEEQKIPEESLLQETKEESAIPTTAVYKETTNPYAIPSSIILASVIIAGAIFFTNSDRAIVAKKGVAEVGGAGTTAGDFKSLEKDAPTLGNPDAPVAVVEFADYQCPFCGRFYSATAKDIIEKYVKTGKVKFIYHDFAFLGEESSFAAEAARCAGDQGKYWEYHNYLFEHQDGENEGAFAKTKLKNFAAAIRLNTGDFNQCLDSGKHTQDVMNDTELGRKFGVTGTPASFVNGKLIAGAVPFSQFELSIIEALNAQ